MAKKPVRGQLSHTFVRVAIIYTPLIGGLVVALLFGARPLDPTYALTILGAEAQVFAMFATLTPIFFVFTQFYGRGKRLLLRDLTHTVIGIIALSVFGIGLCIVSMLTQYLLVFVILFLLSFIVQIALFMALFLLWFTEPKRVQEWLTI